VAGTSLFVADGRRVRRIDLVKGTINTVLGGTTFGVCAGFGPCPLLGPVNTPFLSPAALAVTDAGDLYIADVDAHRIFRRRAGKNRPT
jgi:hypothetical protein